MADEGEPVTVTVAITLGEEEEETKESDGSGLLSAVMAEVSRRSPSASPSPSPEPTEEEEVKEEEKEEEIKEEASNTEEIPKEEVKEEITIVEETTVEEKEQEEKEEKEEEKEEDEEKEEEVKEVENKEEAQVIEDKKDEKEKEEITKKDKRTKVPLIVPHLLSDEEIMSKGVSELEIDNYRKFYLRQAFSPKKWHESIKDNSFPTEFLSLSSDEIEALLASCHLSSEDPPTLTDTQKRVLDELKDKLDTIIGQFGEEGAFIKLNTKMPADAIMEKSNGDYLQSIQEGILTELEIENQFTNAYLIWRSWRSSSFRETQTRTRGDNVLRRSFRRIQKTFRPTSTPPTTGNKDKSGDEPLAEENKEEKKDETAPTTDETTPTTNETAPTETAPVTVEATVEATPTEETAVNPQVTDAVTEAQTTETEPQTTETETEPQTTETETEPQTTETETEPKNTETEAEPQTTETETEPQTADKEGEIQVEESADKTEDEETAPKSKPRSVLKKKSEGESTDDNEHDLIKVKKETLQNKVLRAYMKTMFKQYRVTSGSEVLTLLTTSTIIKEELEIIKTFESVEGTEAILSIIKWSPSEMPSYPGMNFRGFVYQNTLNAVSQHDDILYVPNIARFKDTILSKMKYFFDNDLKEALAQEENYIFDIFVAPNKIYVTGLHPFHQSTGACLFTWRQSQKVLTEGPLELRHVHTPFKKCFSGLLPHWQTICETVTQQKREEEHGNGKQCVIL